jgi:hypothetical protein
LSPQGANYKTNKMGIHTWHFHDIRGITEIDQEGSTQMLEKLANRSGFKTRGYFCFQSQMPKTQKKNSSILDISHWSEHSEYKRRFPVAVEIP